jgi:hypothetical protein
MGWMALAQVRTIQQRAGTFRRSDRRVRRLKVEAFAGLLAGTVAQSAHHPAQDVAL